MIPDGVADCSCERCERFQRAHDDLGWLRYETCWDDGILNPSSGLYNAHKSVEEAWRNSQSVTCQAPASSQSTEDSEDGDHISIGNPGGHISADEDHDSDEVSNVGLGTAESGIRPRKQTYSKRVSSQFSDRRVTTNAQTDTRPRTPRKWRDFREVHGV